MHRRHFVQFTLTAGASALLIPSRLGGQQGASGAPAVKSKPPQSTAALPNMTVYKSASCGCCAAWVEHVQKAGFTVRTVNTDDMDSVKREMGVPAKLQSCHTAVVGNYLIEGHVPATDVKRLLATKPAARGLAVPGMPVGSPGMEQGSPANNVPFDVIAFATDGTSWVFQKR